MSGASISNLSCLQIQSTEDNLCTWSRIMALLTCVKPSRINAICSNLEDTRMPRVYNRILTLCNILLSSREERKMKVREKKEMNNGGGMRGRVKERKKERKKEALNYESCLSEINHNAKWHGGMMGQDMENKYQTIDVAKFKEMDLCHRSHFRSVLSGLFDQS